LGRNTAINLARNGTDVILTYHSNQQEADSAVAEIVSLGRKAVAIQLDTGNVAAVNAFVNSVREALARLRIERFDYLINNAGIAHHNGIEKTTETELDALYNVHLKGVFFLTQKLLPLLNDGGRIVNISSGFTRIIMPGSAPYGSMKAAIEVPTKYMAKEFGPRRIAVNVVAPGAIATDFSGGMVRDNPELNKRVADMTALRACGRSGLLLRARYIGPEAHSWPACFLQ
jgi:NAD(P)-dependent dehydrogenase (short-subunit alcohol dehydrogenase family)